MASGKARAYHGVMIDEHIKGSWVEWESGPAGVEPILVIETDLPLVPGVDGMRSSELDDMIDAAMKRHEKPNLQIKRTRVVPMGPYRA